MVAQTSYIKVRDGCRLFLRRWVLDEGEPRAALLAVHGMAEHSGRYAALAGRLCAEGIETWAFDLRGHGRTADDTVNDAGRGGLLGHCADRRAARTMVGDIDDIMEDIAQKRPGVPCFLLGHSFGSFLVQAHMISGSRRPVGYALSGTRGPEGFPLALGARFLGLYAFFRGRRHLSRFARSLVMGGNNRPFRPARTPADWLSRDPDACDAYLKDPRCGFLMSAGFFRDMLRLLVGIHARPALARVPKDLPVYLFSGSDDPVGGRGKNVVALVKRYKQEHIRDIELVLYPNARHEPLHEINKDEVISNLIDWIKRHI